jgi:hypothetical protein
MTDDKPTPSDVLARAQRARSPSAADAERVRRAIGAALASGGGTGDATGTRAASPPPGWASRILLVGAIAGASAGIGYWAGHRAGLRAAEPRRLVGSSSPARDTIGEMKLPAVAAAAGDATGTPPFAPLPLAPLPLAPSHRDAVRNARRVAETQGPSTTESLAIEVRALRNAERALRDGNPGLALAFLQELDRQVPNGQLAEERDAAATTARCARGDHPFGVNMADEFAQRHPTSVYRARVEQACAPTDSPATGDSLPRRSE